MDKRTQELFLENDTLVVLSQTTLTIPQHKYKRCQDTEVTEVAAAMAAVAAMAVAEGKEKKLRLAGLGFARRIFALKA